jgi:hypothetical protein
VRCGAPAPDRLRWEGELRRDIGKQIETSVATRLHDFRKAQP